MNKISNIPCIPNRIKQPGQCCVYCGKTYKSKTHLNKHINLCELFHKSQRRSSEEEQEELDIPSPKKLYSILLELGQKYNQLEQKIEEVNKWVVKKKKKINAIEWLNENHKPNIVFENMIDKIKVEEEYIKSLFESSLCDVLNDIFSKSLYQWNETEKPIIAFIQKNNLFYIYDSDKTWIELTRERLIKFLNRIHMKIIRAFNEWVKTNKKEIHAEDSLSIKCDKTLVKIMSIEFKQESTLNKMRQFMYSRMKTEMKSIIEYEFEF